MSFDYDGARQAGYSDDEIMSHLSQSNPKFDVAGASKAGYSPAEINQHLISSAQPKKEAKPKRSTLEKAGRVAGQFAIGALEAELLPYEISVLPLASKDAQNAAYRQTVSEDIERLQEQKAMGQWDEQDQELYDSLVEQIKDPKKSGQFVQTADLGVRDLVEHSTGVNLKPEGILEKAANWTGWLKDPKKLLDLRKNGLTPKNIIQAISPTGTDTMRGLAAGSALQLAENGNYGPMGTLVAAIVGDVTGGGVAKAAKTIGKIAANPKKALAEAAAKFTPKEKIDIQKDLIESFNQAGIQADIGTITDSNLLRMMQTRVSQSGLSGKKLNDFKHDLTDQIKREYEGIANSLGEAKFETKFEASSAVREGLTAIREADKKVYRELYDKASQTLKHDSYVYTDKLNNLVRDLETKLKPGSIKNAEQNAVIERLKELKRDIQDSGGSPMMASVQDLMNNKIALSDIINYEMQGGSKQLLKGVVKELDEAILSYGQQNKSFARDYGMANKAFGDHVKAFRNKNMDNILKAADPNVVMNKMNTVQGIKDIEKALKSRPEGQELFNNLKRYKLDEVIQNKMINNTTEQMKLGTFSNILEKGNNKEVVKELLNPQAFKQLQRVQKLSGKLADSVDRFLNTSQSATVAADIAVIGKLMMDFGYLISGNPFPLIKTGALIGSVNQLSSLLSDPTFLKLVENAIVQGQKGSNPQMIDAFMNLKPYAMQIYSQSQDGGLGPQSRKQ